MSPRGGESIESIIYREFCIGFDLRNYLHHAVLALVRAWTLKRCLTARVLGCCMIGRFDLHSESQPKPIPRPPVPPPPPPPPEPPKPPPPQKER